jgi:hypothetical protein
VSHSRSELLALWQVLEQNLLSLLEQLKSTLSPQTYEFGLESIGANEFGITLDAICDELEECGVLVPPKVYEQIETLGRMMEMPEETWLKLPREPNP